MRLTPILSLDDRFPKPTTPQLEQRFTEMLEDIKTEHNSVQANIARGLQVCTFYLNVTGSCVLIQEIVVGVQELSEVRKDLQRGPGVLVHDGSEYALLLSRITR